MKPHLINNLDFATSAQILSGNVKLDDLQRLNDLLTAQLNTQNSAKIEYQLTGSNNKYNLPSLHLTLNAELPTVCQRCLNAMTAHLKLNFDYLVNDTEPRELDGNDDLDWLESSREMNVWELIEDELLIAFPIAPIHSLDNSDCVQYIKQSGEKQNPFAVLKNLSKKTG
jgi:uncharacterized protein